MGSVATEITVNDQQIRDEMSSVLQTVTAMRVTDQESYNAASKLLVAVKNKQKKVTDFFAQMKSSAYTTWKQVCAREAEASAPLAEAERHLKLQISTWTVEQERLRREAERIERERIERERLEALEREIESAERQGASTEEIAAICEMPMPAAAPPPPPPTYQRAAGVGTRQTFKAEVTDLRQLCGAVARGEVPASYVTANLTALNARARADGMLFAVPGVRVVVEAGIAVRTRV